ncbi:MAG: hypothetical protein EOP09_04590 [Proteobacteria bacterium]|nr:MAG: hypothetical protein EOP09_04590 [Pseudomonadota bacterium]
MRIAFFGAWMFGIFFASFVTSDANDFSQPTLCSASEDCLAAYDARGRREWATRCFPSEQLAIESRAHFLDHDGTPHAAYPTFGRVDSRLGSEANWMANSQTRWIAPTQVNASCDVPEHFVIVDYLFRERGTPISNQNSTSLASHDQSGQN